MENGGLIPNVEVQFVKTDPDLIKSISKKINKEESYVRRLMRYNVWTIKQYSLLTGLAISTIANFTRPSVNNGEIVFRLNWCYPFPDGEGYGPKFIYRNEKSEAYIKK